MEKNFLNYIREWRESRGACGIGVLRSSKNDPMNGACEIHDERYINNKKHGGEKLRKEQDLEFLKHMLEISNGDESKEFRAYIYYYIVRGLGWIPWYLQRGNGN